MGVICKYKYDSSMYADFIPEFNSGFSDYVITDEVEGNIITRTIESDKLPTLMRFGRAWVDGEPATDNRTDSLLEVLDMNTNGLTSCHSMFRYCKSLTSISCEWDTSNVTSMYQMFNSCNNLTTLDVSDFNTSKVANMSSMFQNCSSLTLLDVSNFVTVNVTDMSNMFNECNSLTSLDVSNWDTSNVTSMSNLFRRCYVLNELDMSNWDTSKVTAMNYLFSGCDNLIKIDISNFDTSKVTDTEGMFISAVTSKLKYLNISNFDMSANTSNNNWMFDSNPVETVIMFNCNIDTINKIGELYNVSNNLKNATIYVDESLDQSQYTGAVPLKVYKEEKLEIKLNNPLLEGDTIEVVDGKICHVHRMGRVALDGSENWIWDTTTNLPNTNRASVRTAEIDSNMKNNDINTINFCNNALSVNAGTSHKDLQSIQVNSDYIFLRFLKIYAESLEELKIYLNNNPIIYIYELVEPYYEDITPLQSSLVLKTFLESSMTIDTILPIETKLSYRTNVPSISTLSTRATELAESDNVIHNLMNIIDDEVDE